MDKAVVEKDDMEKFIEIDRNKLLQISRELKRSVLRHSKDPSICSTDWILLSWLLQDGLLMFLML